MGCFVVPTTVGIITTACRKEVPEKYHVNWLNTMLWGGSIGLAVEHVAHGEIVSSFPFLTAMKSAAELSVLLNEMATIGVAMTIICVAAWAVMVKAAWIMEERPAVENAQTA